MDHDFNYGLMYRARAALPPPPPLFQEFVDHWEGAGRNTVPTLKEQRRHKQLGGIEV